MRATRARLPWRGSCPAGSTWPGSPPPTATGSRNPERDSRYVRCLSSVSEVSSFNLFQFSTLSKTVSSASTSSSSRLLPLHIHLLLLPLASLLLLIVHHHWVSLQWVRERFLETRELSPVSEREVSLDTSNHTKCTQPLIHLQPERNHRQWQKWSLLLLLLGSYKINLKLMMIDDDYFKWWWWKKLRYTRFILLWTGDLESQPFLKIWLCHRKKSPKVKVILFTNRHPSPCLSLFIISYLFEFLCFINYYALQCSFFSCFYLRIAGCSIQAFLILLFNWMHPSYFDRCIIQVILLL